MDELVTEALPLPHIAARVLNTPLLIEPGKLQSIMAFLGPRLGLESVGAAVEQIQMQRHRDGFKITPAGTAVIGIQGSLVHRSSGFDGYSGVVSYERLSQQIAAAVADPLVKRLLLDIDSGGGEAEGVIALSDMIFEARQEKPVHAIANGQAFSAAYWIASAATKVYLTPSGGVGSIGAVFVHADLSESYRQAGVKHTILVAGKHKADISSLKPLNDSGRETIQGQLDRIYGLFVDGVARNRKLSAETVRGTEARLYFGNEAIEANLADEILTFEEALAKVEKSGYSAKSPLALDVPVQRQQLQGIAMEGQENGTIVGQPVSPAVPTAAAVGGEPPAAGNVVDLNQLRQQVSADAAEIAALCSLAGRPDLSADFIRSGKSLTEIRAELTKMRAAAADGSPTIGVSSGQGGAPAQANIDTTKIYADRAAAMQDAAQRFGMEHIAISRPPVIG